MKTTATLVAVVALVLTGAAAARTTRASVSVLQARAARVTLHIEQAKTTIRWFERHHHGKTIAWLARHPRAIRDVNVARQRVILGRAELARIRALLARRSTPSVAHRSDWLCIYHYENGGHGWAANTGNGYFGGLQMDLEFQRDYGARLLREKGTADHWTPDEQMAVAERARKTRGWWPWPNTARYCGLL